MISNIHGVGVVMSELEYNILNSLKTGFINKSYQKSGNFKPELLINNERKNENVLSTILEELHTCKSFIFSVAFITESGLAMLKSQLLDLKQKGIKGRILTSTYLNFNQPKIFKELLKLENVEVRLSNIEGFHSKGYIFEQDYYYGLVVGSTNLTSSALKVNYEWNVKLTSHENGEIVQHFKDQFEEVWKESTRLSNVWINQYEKTYEKEKNPIFEKVIDFQHTYNSIKDAIEIEPNKMQQEALQQIQAVRDRGKDKSIVVSATGTGKTYLSAFDVRRYKPKRMLFVAHREQILEKAKEDYQQLLGGLSRNFGILSGAKRESDTRYVFATIQTLAKETTLNEFNSNDFDYIIIDEVHKAGAESYNKVIDYFKPKFLLGMTATPERTDDVNVFELFDYNVAYEIRLQDALEADMLCPFHYFGVTDIEINGSVIGDTSLFSNLVTEERVNHILERINYYGYSGNSVKGLIFCSRKDEAKELSRAFNKRGLRTVALTGNQTQKERLSAINSLESGHLDYILTVDIFNEGVDIPCVNQIVMLRQTQSSIVFIQQLGRGLRKHESKKFVSVIDFIGNYKNNYLIPIALSGDRSRSKDNLRRLTRKANFIKGISTINFEEIAAQRIFKSIQTTNLTNMHVLKHEYTQLKNRIGRIPLLYDFQINKQIDPSILAEKHGNYHLFLQKIKEDIPALGTYEQQVLMMLTLEVLNGKRKNELILLRELIKKRTIKKEELIDLFKEENCQTDNETLKSVESILDLTFFTQADYKKYGGQSIVIYSNGLYRFNRLLEESIVSNQYFRQHIKDIVMTAQLKTNFYKSNQKLSLYQKYSRKDACKLLNWEKDESATIFGYKSKHHTCPIFVTYHKDTDVESSINYSDEFINPTTFRWYTRSNRRLSSNEVQRIIYAKENKQNIYIFIKKDDDEGKDFYYLGEAIPDQSTVTETTMRDKKGKELPVVSMNMIMKEPIEHNLYTYLINK